MLAVTAVVHGYAVGAHDPPQLILVEEAGAEQAPELAAELLAEQVVGHDVHSRVKDHQEAAYLVKREHDLLLGPARLESVDHARDERRALADEEDDDDADEHDGGVVPVLFPRVDLLALETRQVHGPDQERVEDDEREERDAAHKDDVKPGVHHLQKDLVGADAGPLHAVDRVHRARVGKLEIVGLGVIFQVPAGGNQKKQKNKNKNSSKNSTHHRLGEGGMD